ncbi:MAG: Ig-like domain-containing protein [Candidatus Omnitrophota bacterium]
MFMITSVFKRFFVLFPFFLVCFFGILQGAIPTQERSALIAFYNATNGDAWGTNWKTPPLDTDGFAMPGTEGSWYGITVESDHVTAIQLNNYNVMGTIPSTIGEFSNLRTLRLLNNRLTGPIPPEIGNLSQLEELFLGSTPIEGSIPPEIGNLTNLQILRLSGTQLSGNIPPALGNFPNLGFLELSGNHLSGSIPPQLGNLHRLGILDLGLNQLSGAIPAELGNLANLEYLILNSNQLSGPIPSELGNLGNVKYVYLINNQLSGSIPPSLGNLGHVLDLWLYNNHLTGPIPPELGNLPNVKKLFLDHNGLSGEIPLNLTHLTTISDLDIGYNCLFSSDPTLIAWLNIHDPDWNAHQDQCGSAPPSITLTAPTGGETWVIGSSHSITWTSIHLTGNIKIELSIDNGSSWTTLTASTANTGSYAWTVPDTPSSQCKVRISDAETGSPSDISDVFAIIAASTPSVTVISPNGGETWTVGSSHTITWSSTGSIDNVKIELTTDNGSSWTPITSSTPNNGAYNWTVPTVSSLQCRVKVSEASTGSPSDQSDGTFSILNTAIPEKERAALIALYNATGGDHWTISSGWKTPPLDTDGFAMRGTEGRWYGVLVESNHVTKIQIYNNNLTGNLPSELEDLNRLIWLYLDSNRLSGPIPGSLGKLSQLQLLLLGQNQLSGSIPSSLGNLSSLKLIELSSNRLTGSIPSGLANAVNLESIQLDQNQLSGDIPSTFGDMPRLQALNLYFNNLSGSIPNSLGNSHSLQYLDLSINRLSGEIPLSLTHLTAIIGLDISHNCLKSTNETVRAWLAIHDPDWELFQNRCEPLHPTISLSRTRLNFVAKKNGSVTGPQDVRIVNTGNGTLNWRINIENAPWLTVSPMSGTGNGQITGSVNPENLDDGTYTGFIRVSDPNATNSPQSITVTLKVKTDHPNEPPFGEFETPQNGATVSGSIAVTGWALDDSGVREVRIYREGEKNALIYIGQAVFVEGARPDIEAQYPDYPNNNNAGWGYMLLTNALPDHGNGTFRLHAIATDIDGHDVSLGIKTITVDNEDSEKPFGAIDTPGQGETIAGKNFINFGWVLTPQPHFILTSGSSIDVWVDGVYVGHPNYNNYREDIETLFPGYVNSEGAGGYFYLDTTLYENGVHTLQWTATDDGENTDGIGSRYFTVLNADGNAGAAIPTNRLPVRGQTDDGVWVKKGYNDTSDPEEVIPDENGTFHITMNELGRIEVHLGIHGIVNRAPLPIGSTLDREQGIFYWTPGPGFQGDYRLEFGTPGDPNDAMRTTLIVHIKPLF